MEGVAVVVLLVAGIGVVVCALWVIVLRDEYAEAEEFPDSVEHAHLRRVAETRVSALCPGAIRLAERERANGVASYENLASAREFWRRFAAASASVERDPIAALRELRGLPDLLEEALRGADQEADMAKDVPRREDGR
ncbi:MAG: hypothetical protein H0W55_15430 [Actinobacteria bacterium]|nr:hypothetical protein [Actinomycetota bacterium]